MKPTQDEVLKTFKGLAIAASRAAALAKENGKEVLVGKLPRRQQDAVRQQLLEIQHDIDTMMRIMTG